MTLLSHAGGKDLVVEFAKHALVAEPGLTAAGLVPDKEPFVVVAGLVDFADELAHVAAFESFDIDIFGHFVGCCCFFS